MSLQILNPERGLIFRIIHRDGLSWCLDNGVHCRNSDVWDPNFVSIGNADLIQKRHRRAVPHAPGGTLSDYVPFYLTPSSIMLMNVETGYNGVPRIASDDILFLISSLEKLDACGVKYLFTDRHASLETAKFYDNRDGLSQIDWKILRERDFARDMNDLGKKERYQAEALVYKHVPVEALLGIGCRSAGAATFAETHVESRKLDLPVRTRTSWYFR